MTDDGGGRFTAGVQVERGLYFSPGYCTPGRFASYAAQLREVLAAAPESVLEIGVGSGVVSGFLRRAGIPVTTLDIDPALRPDVTADAAALPFRTRAFCASVCFEVLEHLPFSCFVPALAELRRVTRGRVFLGLPHAGRYYSLSAKLPKLHPRVLVEVPYLRPPVHVFDGEHYWEIGRREYPFTRIEAAIGDAGLAIEKYSRIFEHPYNAIFVLSAK